MTRVFTTIVLAAAVLAGVWWLPVFYFKLAVLFITGLGLQEYAKLAFQDNPTRIFVVLLGLGVAAFLSFGDLALAPFLAPIILFFSFLWGLQYHKPIRETLPRVALMVLGVCYLGLTLPFWGRIREFGPEMVFLVLFPTLLSDTFGFLVGKSVGRHKMAPEISPQKTWEGFAGSLLGGGIFGLWLAHELFMKNKMQIEWVGMIVLGLGISLIAVLGDLIESLIKRSVGVKDSSQLIPGHGGALDRLDALVFTAPFFYAYFLNVWMFR